MTAAALADPSLAGRLAVVTGASRGVGGAIAAALAGAGATVVGVSRNGAPPDRTEAVSEGGRIEAVALDLVDLEAVGRFATALTERSPAVSILVHAAGQWATGPIETFDVATFDALHGTNLRGPWALSQRLVPALRSTTGDVVFVTSTAAGKASLGGYAASKAGLRALADTLRDELNPDGVRVTTIELGRTATDMQRAVHAAEGRAFDPARLIQPGDVARIVLAALTLPRTAQISEVRLLPTRRV